MQVTTNSERIRLARQMRLARLRRLSQNSKRTKKALGDGGKYILLLVLAMVFIGPFFWLINISLTSTAALGAFPTQFWPSHPIWDNFVQAFTSINFIAYAGNSLILSTIYATLVTLTSALVGFGFARLNGPGKRPLFLVMLSTLMVPNIVTLIPIYMVFSHVGLVDTYWPWVLWGLGATPFLVFLFRQFFSSIPAELEEAAILDGCGYGRIFWQFFLPLAIPAVVTAFLISFTGVWGDYLTPLLLLSQDNTTLAVAMTAGYLDPHGFPIVTVQAAGTLLYIIPEILLFIFAQRYFVQGVVTSGLKG